MRKDKLEIGNTGLLIRNVVEVVETLLECYYPRLQVTTNRSIPCTHCILKQPESKPYLFTYSECTSTVTSGINYLFCNKIQSPSRAIPVHSIALDMSFSDIEQINESALTIDHIIGEGSFGTVHSGSLLLSSFPSPSSLSSPSSILSPSSVSSSSPDSLPVAIKSIKLCTEDQSLKFWEFQQESYVMRYLTPSLPFPPLILLFY